jgi:hypothetical protein
MTKLGTSELGFGRIGSPISETGSRFADAGPRKRAEDIMLSSFPHGESDTWDDLLDTLAVEFRADLGLIDQTTAAKFIDTAQGAQLERIGDLVGVEKRTDETYEHYQRRVRLAIPASTRAATIEDITEMSTFLLECDLADVQYVESPEFESARFDLQVRENVFSETSATVDEFETLLQKIKPAGVKARAAIGKQFTHRSVDDADTGTNDPDRAYSETSSDGSIDESTGAPYADVVSRRFAV